MALVAFILLGAWVEQRGARFFDSGHDVVVGALEPFGLALAKNDLSVVERLYADDFSGTRLGLMTRTLVEEKDGIKRYVLESDGAPADRAAALAEWREYHC